MTCACFARIVLEALPTTPVKRLLVEDYLKLETENSSRLFWEIKKHQLVSKAKATQNLTCKEKFKECSEKFVLEILFNLYRRHHATLQILETQVIGKKYRKLTIEVPKNSYANDFLGGSNQIYDYIYYMKKFIFELAKTVKVFNYTTNHIDALMRELENHQNSLNLLQLIYSLEKNDAAEPKTVCLGESLRPSI